MACSFLATALENIKNTQSIVNAQEIAGLEGT